MQKSNQNKNNNKKPSNKPKKDSFDIFFDNLDKKIDNFYNKVDKGADKLYDKIDKKSENIEESFSKGVNSIERFFIGIYKGIRLICKKIKNFFKNLYSALKKAWNKCDEVNPKC